MISIDMNLVWNLINILVLFLVLKHFLFKPVLGIMEKREKLIQSRMEKAGQAKEEAEALKSQYQESIRNAREDSRKILDEARENGKAEYERIVNEANEKAGKIISQAQKTAASDTERAKKDMESEIAALAMAAAAKIMGENQDTADSRAYQQFLNTKGE
ncbi:MAG TPA: F0F1 ATP synthase subunit B [Candidatus Bariatricus faecipullorum]|nr:F0F1 ATP synthase subunit B [Candidatus Bariatricus faecipullorum]